MWCPSTGDTEGNIYAKGVRQQAGGSDMEDLCPRTSQPSGLGRVHTGSLAVSKGDTCPLGSWIRSRWETWTRAPGPKPGSEPSSLNTGYP